MSPLLRPTKIETEEIANLLLEISSEVEIVTNTSYESGEFCLSPAEWDSICTTGYTGIVSLMSNWTNVFADKFHEISNMCVLKFNYDRLRQTDSRKVIYPFSELEPSVNLIIVESTYII